MRTAVAALTMLGVAGCTDDLGHFHHLNGSVVDAKQLTAARKSCSEAQLDTTASISPPASATLRDSDYAEALRAQLHREATERDDMAICMVRQDVFADKESEPGSR